MHKAGLCGDHFSTDAFTNSQKQRLCIGVNPIPWNIKEQYQDMLKMHGLSGNLSKTSLLNEDINTTHESVPVINQVNEVEMSDGGNDISINLDITRESSLKSYPSGKEIFCEFNSEDSNINYLNEEANDLNTKISSQTLRIDANEAVNQRYHIESSKNPDINITAKSKLINIRQVSKRNSKLQKHVYQLNCGLKSSIRTQKENLQLRKKIKILESIVQKQKNNLQKYKNKNNVLVEKLDINNYLDYQKCTSPLSRTMIKLQLHKKKCSILGG